MQFPENKMDLAQAICGHLAASFGADAALGALDEVARAERKRLTSPESSIAEPPSYHTSTESRAPCMKPYNQGTMVNYTLDMDMPRGGVHPSKASTARPLPNLDGRWPWVR